MRLRRTSPTPTTTDENVQRRTAWDGIAVTADAPVVVIHARRASEILDAQQVA